MMASLQKFIVSAAFFGLVGAGAWGAWGHWHNRAGDSGNSSPTAKSDRLKPGGPALPGSQAANLPKPASAVAAAPAQPSFLYIRYLPDAPESAGGAADAATDVATPADLGTPHQFPAPRLRVNGKADDTVQVLLFSDDPKEAMDKNWTGDRYYFSINLQQMAGVKRVEDRLDGAQWFYTASSTEREENANGLFLHGDQMHLEPVRMGIALTGQAPNVLVNIGGEFLQYDTSDPDAKPKRCLVQGILAPRVEIK